MTDSRRCTIWTAALAASALAGGCMATSPDLDRQTLIESGMKHDAPRSNVWISFSPGGHDSLTEPKPDGTALVTVGERRPPIFSLRLDWAGKDGALEASLLTRAGFDHRHILAGDIRRDEGARDPDSQSAGRETRLENALMHHRPAVRFRLDREGSPRVRNAAEIQRHQSCARRLMGKAVEDRMASSRNETQRQKQRERPQADPAGRIAPPVDQASLLLRLSMLSLPSATLVEESRPVATGPGRLESQWDWRSMQIPLHGRPVRLRLDLRSAAGSPAASLCRSLAYANVSRPSSDTCTIEGVIDRRDRWPIALTISRRGTFAGGATEIESRSFNRIAPLQGFVAPSDPCSAGS